MSSVNNDNIRQSTLYFDRDDLWATSYANQSVHKGSDAVCLSPDDLSLSHAENPLSWVLMPIEECLVIRAEEHCQLLYSPPICLAIMLSAFAKIVAMFLAAHLGRSRSSPQLTVGDAVASFMAKPDPTTKGLCWISGAEVRRGRWANIQQAGFQAVQQDEQRDTITYKRLKGRRIWGRAASWWRWLVMLSICFACIIVGLFLLRMDVGHRAFDKVQWINKHTSIFKSLFGSDMTEEKTVDNVPMGLNEMLPAVIVANTPQLAVTISYYCYNAVLTSMLAAREYSSYGAISKVLRVTWPVKGSQQRSTYWLSIPYKYSVPILALYMILHWLISQSIFYFLLVQYNPANEVGDTISSLGYSTGPIFLSILVGAVMVLVLILLAFRRLKSTIPVTGSTSVAISAACHPPKDEVGETAVLGPVKWGETMMPPAWMIETRSSEGPDDGQKGHCSFTSLETKKPSLTKLYA